MNVCKKLNLNMLQMDNMLDPINNFDIIKRQIIIGDRQACFYYVDGFLKDSNMQEVLKFFLLIESQRMTNIKTAQEFVNTFMTYPEINLENKFDEITTSILAGCVGLFIDDIDECIIIDVREYPQRQIAEPEKDKVLRGARDGFIETPIQNVALIRRRIRNNNLKVENISMGNFASNDVVICYMSNLVDKNTLKIIKDRLNKITPNSLTMGAESLVEALVVRKWYNPFPKVRYTERPDVAAANILEGRIILLVDNTPSVIILPTYLVDFFNEAEDYYFNPPIAFYLKISRILIFLITLLITPVWLFIVSNIDKMPSWLQFLKIQEMTSIPLLFQLIILEFIIDIIKAASINTPSMISNSIALIGTIILGDIAVTSKIIIPEVMLCTALVSLGYYSQSSYELGYAVKSVRIIMLILVSLFNIWGLILGVVLFIIMVGFNKTISGQSYLYPIIPFNGHDFSRIFFRRKNA